MAFQPTNVHFRPRFGVIADSPPNRAPGRIEESRAWIAKGRDADGERVKPANPDGGFSDKYPSAQRVTPFL
jgi:hypothetical protein